jgi:hypothetical protein
MTTQPACLLVAICGPEISIYRPKIEALNGNTFKVDVTLRSHHTARR